MIHHVNGPAKKKHEWFWHRIRSRTQEELKGLQFDKRYVQCYSNAFYELAVFYRSATGQVQNWKVFRISYSNLTGEFYTCVYNNKKRAYILLVGFSFSFHFSSNYF